MNRVDYLRSLTSPLPNAVLKKYPQGNIMQLWGESPELYSAGMDAFHVAFGGHMGIDIATFHRDPIHAAHGGVVIIVNSNFKDGRLNQGGIEVWITSPELDGESPGNSRIHLRRPRPVDRGRDRRLIRLTPPDTTPAQFTFVNLLSGRLPEF